MRRLDPRFLLPEATSQELAKRLDAVLRSYPLNTAQAMVATIGHAAAVANVVGLGRDFFMEMAGACFDTAAEAAKDYEKAGGDP